MENYVRGSEWRRWDLHIHTPNTKKNDQFIGSTLEDKWENFYSDIDQYVKKDNSPVSQIACIGITDYLSIENYLKVIDDKKLPDCIKLVLPNIEMRIQPIAHDSPINIHFLFDPEFATQIESRFFAKLSFTYSNTNFSASKNELIRLGKEIAHDLSDAEAYKKGIEYFVPSISEVKKLFESDADLRDHVIIGISNSTSDGVSGATNHSDYLESGDNQLIAFRQDIYKFADVVFSAKPSDVSFFLGEKKSCPVEKVKKECGKLMPCIHGSDAHQNSKIFEPDLKRYCWIKADPTFEGLKQITFEPAQRVKISEYLPEEKNGYNVIDKVIFKDPDFQEEPIYFNENLNCIIGGKSTGKSILIQNLARTIDESQTTKHLETATRKTKNDVNLDVFWKDGKNENHKIIYIPQTYLNHLSEEKENQTEIDEWIEEILLKNNNIRKSKADFNKMLTEHKMYANKLLLDFLNLNNEFKKITDEKLEIGNKEGIIAEISKLNKEKEKIIAQSEISEEELKNYEKITVKLSEINKQKNTLKLDEENLNILSKLSISFTNTINLSDETNKVISSFISNIQQYVDAQWIKEKQNIINSINSKIQELEKSEKPLIACVNELKPKVESNETVKIITRKIQQESAKLTQIKELEELEHTVKEKKDVLLCSLASSGEKYKHLHEMYAKIINNNSIETDGLLFQGETPFRREMFIDKMISIYNTRTREFKDLIDVDGFDSSRYTPDLIKTIIESTLNNNLALKAGNTVESALREVLDNWYNIVYRVKMEEDSIDKMSPGKKALVLLKILISMAENTCPILIDQPEDDLDNRSIYVDLINFIKEKKINRQIIVVTHNANIVLGADSENIIIANQAGTNTPNKYRKFEYRNGSIENNKSIKKNNGNKEDGVLNQRGIQQHICDILEGGEIAFEIRKKKYRI